MTEPDVDFDALPICYECGNDIGPYDGLCLDCLEELSAISSPEPSG